MSTGRTLYQMRVLEIIDHSPSIRELVLGLAAPSEFIFRAGQFVMLHVPGQAKPALRAYSVASDDRSKNGFHLLFKKIPNGVASTFIWALKGQEVLDFTGPFGRVFFHEPPSSQIVFFNTGTGLSQHYSYLASKKDLYPHLQYHLYFGVNDEKEIYYTKQLDQLKRELTNFKYHFVVNQPSTSWQGKKGYVQQHLGDIDYKNTDTSFYLCGNGNMIKETKQLLIERDHFDKTKIFTEAFD